MPGKRPPGKPFRGSTSEGETASIGAAAGVVVRVMKRILHGKAAVAWMILGRGVTGVLLAALLLWVLLGLILNWQGRREIKTVTAELQALAQRIPSVEEIGISPYFQADTPRKAALLHEAKAWDQKWPFQEWIYPEWGSSTDRPSNTLEETPVGFHWKPSGRHPRKPSWSDIEAALAPGLPRIEELRAESLAESPGQRRNDLIIWEFAEPFENYALADLHAGRLARLPDWVALMPYAETTLVWEGLQHEGWTEADLARLAQAWDSFDPIGRQERVVWENWRREPNRPRQPLFEDGALNWDGIKSLAGAALSHSVLLDFTRDQILDADRMRNGSSYRELAGQRVRRKPGLLHLYVGLGLDAPAVLDNILNGLCRQQAMADFARTAIALARYRLAQGAYPDALDALVPAYLAKVPRDPFDGAPLRYHLRPNGTFLLYSVGKEGKPLPLDAAGNPRTTAHDSFLFWPELAR